MERELFEKLQLIAEAYGKTSDLRSYVKNGNGMYLDESNREIRLLHPCRQEAAMNSADIIAAMKEYGYSAVIAHETEMYARLCMMRD